MFYTTMLGVTHDFIRMASDPFSMRINILTNPRQNAFMGSSEQNFGILDLDAFIETRIILELKNAPPPTQRPNGDFVDMRGLREKFKGTFLLKATVVLIGVGLLLGFIGTVLPPSLSMAISMIAFVLVGSYLAKETLLSLFQTGQHRFISRSRALHAICEVAGMTYVPMPGGASVAAKKFARWWICPPELRAMIQDLDSHGGLNDIADIVRRSGLTMPSGFVIASDKNYERYYQQQFDQQQFEDGFQGQQGGIPFSALEWQEQSQSKSQHHLLLVLEIPTRLTGLVEFKSKSENWPLRPRSLEQDKVKLISHAFHKEFDVRAQDQMEARLIFDPAVIERITAFAEGQPVRGAAFEQYLVFDIAGHNRFNLVDLVSGKWSRETILQTLRDVADMLELVDGVAQVFRVKKQFA